MAKGLCRWSEGRGDDCGLSRWASPKGGRGTLAVGGSAVVQLGKRGEKASDGALEPGMRRLQKLEKLLHSFQRDRPRRSLSLAHGDL